MVLSWGGRAMSTRTQETQTPRQRRLLHLLLRVVVVSRGAPLTSALLSNGSGCLHGTYDVINTQSGRSLEFFYVMSGMCIVTSLPSTFATTDKFQQRYPNIWKYFL